MDRATSNSSFTYFQGTSTSPLQTVYGVSNSTNGDPLTWSTLPAPSAYFQRADARFTTLKDIPIRPALSGGFSSGVWTGLVSVPVTGSALTLKAQAGAVNGASNAIAVNAPPIQPNGNATVLAEDFESGTLNPAYWTVTGTGNFHTINSDLNTPHLGLRHMTEDVSTYTGAYARNEATLTVNLAGRSGVALSFWAKGFSETPHGPPPSPFPGTGADFDGVAISADGGVNWYEVLPLRSLTNTYVQYTVNLDAALATRGLAYGGNFKIRFNQYDYDYIPFRGIAIDDILIAANPTGGFTLVAPVQVSEGAGSVSGSITLATASATDTVLLLAASAPAKLTVPASVTVPAGQTVATFPITVIEDGIADGNRTVTLTGTITGQLARSILIVVLDNDALPFTLAAPTTVVEGVTGQTGTITLGGLAAGVITVNLASSDTTAVQVPASVVFQPGQQTATFPITIVDDTKIDGTQVATITASVPGWTDATATVQVTDNETRNLSISAPFSVNEGGTATGTVSLSGTLPAPLTVALTSANPAQITVPASVTIAAGATSATFVATGVDDTLLDGTQTVALTAAAATFTSATGNTLVYDNDVHHFTFASTIASPQIANRIFATSIEARDVNNVRITTYSGVLNLTAAGSGGPLTVAPVTVTLASGFWSGNLAIASPATGVTITARNGTLTGVSNSFDVTFGVLDHLTWSAIASPQTAGVPFTATLLAKDAAENTVTTVNGAVSVSAGPASGVTGTGTGEAFTLFESNAQERNQLLYQRAQVGSAGRINSLAMQLNVLSGGTVATTVRMKHTTLADFGTSAAWENTGWTIVYQGNLTFTAGTGAAWLNVPLTTPFQFDGTSNLMVDISHNGGALHVHSITTTMTTARTLYYFGSGYADPLTWSGVSNPTPNPTTGLLNLRLGFEGAVPVAPASVTLANGAWTGSFAVQQAASGILLKALTAGGIAGESNVFTVTSPPIPTLAVSPADGLTTGGPRGGPFTPAAKVFTLSNPGVGTVAWTASKTAGWLILSTSGGTLAAGASTTVIVSPNAAANALAAGSFTDTLTFTNTTNGNGNTTRPVSLTVTPIGELTVTPATNLDASGPVGGPFTPASRAYTLTNSGDAALSWTAAKTTPWLALSSASGTLAPAASATVTATIAGSSLEAGSYSDNVVFTNTTTGRGNTTRAATLSVILPAPVLAPEPPITGGTSNTVSWSAVSAAGDYEAQAASDAAFTSPVSSGWITGTSHTFAGLSDGTPYRYRARARRLVPEPTGAWTQTSQAEFNTGTPVSVVANPSGDVTLVSGTGAPIVGRPLNASFENGVANGGTITDWSVENTPSMGGWLYNTATSPFPTNGSNFLITFTYYQTTHVPGDYARTFQSVDFTGANTMVFDAALRSSGAWSGSILAEVRIDGVSVWSRTAQGTYLNQSVNVSALAGVHVVEFRTSVMTAGTFDSQWAEWDNVRLLSAVGYVASGTLASPAIAPVTWQRWGVLTFNRDASAAGTALTVDVLNPVGTVLAANVASGTDLNGIPAVATQPSIRLRANLSTSNSANTPRLDDWTVSYVTVSAQTAISAWSNVAISTQDATAPTLAVTSPATASTVLPAISGTAADAGGIASVLVNGVAATSSDGFAHWTAAVPLAIGVNNLSIVARDNAIPANVRTIPHTVTVTPTAGDADGDGLPDVWEALYGLSTTGGTGADGAFGDPDGDGRVTVLELALGSNPVVPDSGGAASPALVLDAYDGKTYLTWQYRRLLAPGALSYFVETTTDLANWHSGPGWVEQVGATVPTGDGLTETVTIRALPAVDAGGATGHMRLRITLP